MGGSTTSPSVCECKEGFEKTSDGKCVSTCGDGLKADDEKCDDKSQGGCKDGCMEVSTNFTCEGGNGTHPSECKCIDLHEKANNKCVSVYGSAA